MVQEWKAIKHHCSKQTYCWCALLHDTTTCRYYWACEKTSKAPRQWRKKPTQDTLNRKGDRG